MNLILQLGKDTIQNKGAPAILFQCGCKANLSLLRCFRCNWISHQSICSGRIDNPLSRRGKCSCSTNIGTGRASVICNRTFFLADYQCPDGRRRQWRCNACIYDHGAWNQRRRNCRNCNDHEETGYCSIYCISSCWSGFARLFV